MPNDAKLGLVVGVSLVIVIAVVFFRKDVATGAGSVSPPINGVQPAAPPMQPANNRIVVASPTVHEPAKTESAPTETRLLERQMTPGLPRLDPETTSPPANTEPDDPN
jgi:hypothetical protein